MNVVLHEGLYQSTSALLDKIKVSPYFETMLTHTLVLRALHPLPPPPPLSPLHVLHPLHPSPPGYLKLNADGAFLLGNVCAGG